MQEIGRIILCKGMEYTCFQTGKSMKGMLKKESKLAKVNIYTVTTTDMTGNGLMTKSMGLANITTKIREKDMKDSLRTDQRRVMASFITLMVTSTKEHFTTEINMVVDLQSIKMAPKLRVPGKMGN